MPSKKSTPTKAKKSGGPATATMAGGGKSACFGCPCSDFAEIRFQPGVQVHMHIGDKFDRVMELENPEDGKGLIICAQVGEGEDGVQRHIFIDADRRADPPLVTVHEVKSGFPGVDTVPSPCKRPRKRR